jgi:Ca2+/Na+ antiporter
MELDNLKDLWRNLKEDDHRDDDEQIIKILHKKSQSPIAKMKRNLSIELMAVIILYSFAIWYFLQASGSLYQEVALVLFGVAILFIFYYYKKNRLLGQMQCVTCEVRSNLQKQLTTLEKYVQFYFVGGIIVTPIAYFVPGIVVLLKYPDRNIAAGFTESAEYFVFIVIGILLTIGSYFLNKWYLKKLYGQHIKKLKELLLQMEEKEQLYNY